MKLIVKLILKRFLKDKFRSWKNNIQQFPFKPPLFYKTSNYAFYAANAQVSLFILTEISNPLVKISAHKTN